MNQSSIFLTHTFLDLDKLIPHLACSILEQVDSGKNFKLPTIFDQMHSSAKWEMYINSERVILPNWLSKDDFREELSGLYKHYTTPTLLFLGDLGSMSVPAQESLLKLIEETPHNLHPILFSPDIFNILPTIKSRCQIYNLSMEICTKFLDSNLMEICKKKYPDVSLFAINFVNGRFTDLTVLNKAERNEITFWLWLVLQNLEAIYSEQSSKNVAEKIKEVLESMRLNSNNLQKKFALGGLVI